MKTLCPIYLGTCWQICLFYQTPWKTVAVILQTNIDSEVINNTRNTGSGLHFNSYLWGLLGRYCLSEDFDFVGMIFLLIDSDSY